MNKVGVVTDSVSCIPKDVIKQYDIKIVPINLIIDGESYADGVDIDTVDYYRRLKKFKELPTTSAPSPGAFYEAFRELSKTTDSAICITVTSELSATYDSAIKAAEQVSESKLSLEVKVVDSHSAAGAEGFMALAAARAAADGKDIDRVLAAVHDVRSKVHLLAMLDTMHYLVKGGRVSRAAALAVSLFRIKPILELKPDGHQLELLERIRTKRRGKQRLIEIMRERTNDDRLHVNVHHADAFDEADEMGEKIMKEFKCAEIYITNFTPVMGTHTGPGLLGLSFYSDD